MYKAFGVGLLVSLCASGCSVGQSSKCWHPETKSEMRMLIGNTVMEAVHQYNKQILKKSRILKKRKPYPV